MKKKTRRDEERRACCTTEKMSRRKNFSLFHSLVSSSIQKLYNSKFTASATSIHDVCWRVTTCGTIVDCRNALLRYRPFLLAEYFTSNPARSRYSISQDIHCNGERQRRRFVRKIPISNSHRPNLHSHNEK